VLELRHLDLQLALAALRPLGEDLEDQQFAVEHRHLQRPLQVALLRRAERYVEDGDRRPALLQDGGQFLDLAAAEVERGVGSIAPRARLAGNREAGRRRELADLVERVGSLVTQRAAGDDDADQKRARLPVRPRRLDLERGQASDSVARLTGRAGTTVEMACL
jgi:hypothetical protein